MSLQGIAISACAADQKGRGLRPRSTTRSPSKVISPWPASFPSPFPPDRPPASVDGDRLRIVYVGHASFLVQTRGMNILIDPVWAERASPLSFVGPKRANRPGIAFDDLPLVATSRWS